MHSPLIVIAGATGSGKTDFAMRIAEKYSGEIICADSRTIYRGMDIGTAKPSAQDRARIPHHLLDIVEPGETFSASQFKERAVQTIRDIHKRGKLPLLVGGTGLYIDAVVFNYGFGGKVDHALRARLEQYSTEKLQELCREKNIDLPQNLKNKRHLISAIERNGFELQKSSLRPDTLYMAISIEKSILVERLARRADNMFKAGILNEIQLLASRYGRDSEVMKGNAYRIFGDIVDKKTTPIDAVASLVRSDMQLAKRQKTWFKRHPEVIWGDVEELSVHIQHFLAKYP